MQRQFEPMLAEKTLPEKNGEWYAEPKYDGTRAILIQYNNQIAIYHRSGHNRTNRYPELTEINHYPQNIILDGEIVVLNEKGVPEFNLLQQRQTDRPALINTLRHRLPVTYYAFDILALGDQDLRDRPLTERKKILHQQLEQTPNHPTIQETPSVKIKHEDIDPIFKTLVQKGYEGIILKRPNSKYVSGRSKEWIKIKAIVSDDLYIIGYTEGTGWRKKYFGSLVLAKTPDGEPVCKVGTGFNNLTLKMMTEILKKHQLGETYQIDGEWVQLVEPIYKAEIEYLNGTTNRFPSFKRLIPPDGEE